MIDVASLLLGAGIGVGGGGLGWWLFGRRSRSAPATLPSSPSGDDPPTRGVLDPLGPDREIAAPSLPSSEVAPSNSSRVLPTRPLTSRSPPSAKPSAETLVISERVLLHLLALPALGPYRAAELGRTQAGMCERLDLRQGSLTRVLARLEASGAVSSERGHVEGVGQRLKVYALTPLGESVARGIRTRRATLDVEGPECPGGPRLGQRPGPKNGRRSPDRPEHAEPRLEYIR